MAGLRSTATRAILGVGGHLREALAVALGPAMLESIGDGSKLGMAAKGSPEIDRTGGGAYPVRMKRTNLVLDEHLLEEAVRLSGERTYSAVVGRALADFVRRVRANRILELAGSGLWEGDLATIRGDRRVRRRTRGSR